MSHSPALLAAVAALFVVPVWSQSTIVVDPQGGEPDFSLDERWLAHTRLSTPRQVYVFDRVTATSALVSKAPNGAAGNGESRSPSISGDGRWVAFESDATNLALPQVFGQHVWVHDRVRTTNALVSVRSNGAAGNDSSYAPSISADGAFVAFHSRAQMTPQAVSGVSGVQWAYAQDRVASQTHWV
jgi:Tol biopolymer transport system component